MDKKIYDIIDDKLGGGSEIAASNVTLELMEGPFFSKINEKNEGIFEIQGSDDCAFYFGCSRIAFVPKSEKEVIKMPITKIFQEEEDGDERIITPTLKIEKIVAADLMDEENAIFDDEPTLREILLPNKFEGYYNGIPVYTQEKAIDYLHCYKRHLKPRQLKKVKDFISSDSNFLGLFPKSWIYNCIQLFGKEKTHYFFSNICSLGIDDDLHWGNFGYTLDNRPCIFDYATCHEDEIWKKVGGENL